MKSLEENLQQGINHAKMLMRSGDVESALLLIDNLEQRAGPYLGDLSPQISYLIPFSRGRAYLQIKQPLRAMSELETALKLASTDIEASARSENMLGVAFYQQEDPAAALSSHLACVRFILGGPINDLNFQFSVYHNLANDYWALNDMPHAISMYKEALTVLKDLDAPERQASIHWGLALAYKALWNWRYAKLHITRAIQIYRSISNGSAEAAMHVNFAEILLEEGRTDKVARHLDQAGALLTGTSDYGALSFMHRYYAELDRKNGNLEEAAKHAAESIAYAEILLSPDNIEQSGQNRLWADPTRTFVEALHGAALVEEERGDREAADQLFIRALDQLQGVTAKEVKYSLNFSYATILESRGDFGQAIHYYREATQTGSYSGVPTR